MANPKLVSPRPGLTFITAMALLALFCYQPPAARADTIQTFAISGSFTPVPGSGYTPGSNTFSGTLTVDTTIGTLTGADITFPGLPTLATVVSSQTDNSQDLWSVSLQDHIGSPPPTYYTLALVFHTGQTPASLVGFNGGALTTVHLTETTLHPDTSPTSADLASGTGSIAPQATPEPGCALLAGLGLICFAGLSWKFNRQVHI